MKNHNTKVDDFFNTQNYIAKSNMESDKVWSTEVEMQIYYIPSRKMANQWLRCSHSL